MQWRSLSMRKLNSLGQTLEEVTSLPFAHYQHLELFLPTKCPLRLRFDANLYVVTYEKGGNTFNG